MNSLYDWFYSCVYVRWVNSFAIVCLDFNLFFVCLWIICLVCLFVRQDALFFWVLLNAPPAQSWNFTKLGNNIHFLTLGLLWILQSSCQWFVYSMCMYVCVCTLSLVVSVVRTMTNPNGESHWRNRALWIVFTTDSIHVFMYDEWILLQLCA